jgi:flagellar biosynthesis protein FliQ
MFFVFLVMLALGPWYLKNILTFFRYIYENIPVFLIK